MDNYGSNGDGFGGRIRSDQRYKYIEYGAGGNCQEIAAERKCRKLKDQHKRLLEKATNGLLTFEGDTIVSTNFARRRVDAERELLAKQIEKEEQCKTSQHTLQSSSKNFVNGKQLIPKPKKQRVRLRLDGMTSALVVVEKSLSTVTLSPKVKARNKLR